MGKHRSPNCPQITFAEAIEKGRKVYEQEHTHPAAKIVVAQDLGYSSINGRSLTLIGALRQYGILEGSADSLRVTQDAIAYFERDNGPEKVAAMRRMALAPDLFAELAKLHIHGMPSDGNLRYELIQKGFTSKAADDVIKVYKANVQLATGEQGVYDEQEKDEEEPPAMSTPASTPNVTKVAIPPQPSFGAQSYAFALSPDARAELVLRGTLTADDFEMLRDHIELTIKALTRKAKEQQQ
ncbi:MAG: hypothetical protein ACLGSH_06115 [Acidobacteriota bacterium]